MEFSCSCWQLVSCGYCSSFCCVAVAVVVRVVMVMVVTAVVPVTASLTAAVATRSIFCGYTPEAMAAPGALLAFFRAVLGAATAAAFGELASILLPLATLPVSALADATAGVVLTAEIAHHHAGPVAHLALLRGDGPCGGVAGGS